MTEFSTKDISGNICKFQCEINNEFPPEVKFFVYELERNDSRYFQAIFKIIDESTAQSVIMDTSKFKEFEKKGIPERIIEIAACYLKRNIRSSSIKMAANNFQIPDARKAWERLVSKNPNASFVKEHGFYVLKVELPK